MKIFYLKMDPLDEKIVNPSSTGSRSRTPVSKSNAFPTEPWVLCRIFCLPTDRVIGCIDSSRIFTTFRLFAEINHTFIFVCTVKIAFFSLTDPRNIYETEFKI